MSSDVRRLRRVREEIVVRSGIGALVLGFLATADVPMIGGPPHLTSVVAALAIVLNAPYYLLAARWPRSLRTQAYGRLIVDILFITLGLYSAGGLAAAPYIGVYGVIPVYVGLALSGSGCLVATAVSTVSYLALAAAQQAGWLDLEPLPPIAWVSAIFNLVIVNVVGALTAFLAGAYRRSRDRLRENEERYRTLFEQAPVGVYRAMPDGRIVVANPSLVRMLGYGSAEELVAQAPSSRSDVLADVDGVMRGVDVEWKRKDGSLLFVREHRQPIRDAAGALRYYEGAVEDVTERKALEDQLRQSQKLDAIGRLAGGVAHDFNNLLTAIVGYAELIPQRAEDPAFVRYGAQEIGQAAAHASALTRQLLAFSRGQSREPLVLDLNQVVTRMEEMVRRLIGEDVELAVVTGGGPARVKADAGQLEQVVLNLVVNARDAMPDGGRLTIETATVHVAAHEAQRFEVAPGPYVVLSASDTGIGMDAATQARIFDPFFTTKSVDKGTGLGLSTVYGIVKQSGGTVRVQSEPGHGATFRIYLPAVAGASMPSALPTAPVAVPGGSETILLVEDDERVRLFMHDSLRASGYKVLCAQDGTDALSVAAVWSGPIDLMVTDFVMPHMNGRDVARHFASLRPAMKVLFVSGYTARESPAESEAGLEHFLPKPFGPDMLARKVRDVLDAAPT